MGRVVVRSAVPPPAARPPAPRGRPVPRRLPEGGQLRRGQAVSGPGARIPGRVAFVRALPGDPAKASAKGVPWAPPAEATAARWGLVPTEGLGRVRVRASGPGPERVTGKGTARGVIRDMARGVAKGTVRGTAPARGLRVATRAAIGRPEGSGPVPGPGSGRSPVTVREPDLEPVLVPVREPVRDRARVRARIRVLVRGLELDPVRGRRSDLAGVRDRGHGLARRLARMRALA